LTAVKCAAYSVMLVGDALACLMLESRPLLIFLTILEIEESPIFVANISLFE
jgi:hypothetical protein